MRGQHGAQALSGGLTSAVSEMGYAVGLTVSRHGEANCSPSNATSRAATASGGVTDPTHNHTTAAPFNGPTTGGSTYVSPYIQTAYTGNSLTGITIQNAGSGNAHTHTFTSSALNINYANMILCSKN